MKSNSTIAVHNGNTMFETKPSARLSHHISFLKSQNLFEGSNYMKEQLSVNNNGRSFNVKSNLGVAAGSRTNFPFSPQRSYSSASALSKTKVGTIQMKVANNLKPKNPISWVMVSTLFLFLFVEK